MLGEESQGQALDLRSAQKWVEKRLLQTYADEDPSWHNIVVEEGSGLSRNNRLSR
jgi:D-alanyl-D-alanine carboxypeptidase